MHQCHDCHGFIPAHASLCPNCQVQHKPSFSQCFKRVMQLVLGSSVTMTLAACYGTPPPTPRCDETNKDTQACKPSPSPSGSNSTVSPSPSPAASPTSQPSSGT